MEFTRRAFAKMTVMGILASSLPGLAEESTELLRPNFKASLTSEGVEVALELTNRSKKPIDIMTWQGWSGGIEVSFQGSDSDDWIPLVTTEKPVLSEFETMSRLGPRPRWQTLEAGGKQSFGAFREQKSSELKGQTIRLRLTLRTSEGELDFPPSTVKIERS